MRVGVSLTTALEVRDPREGARMLLERAEAARAAGLDSLFVGDHHSTPGPYYQNVPTLARLLAEWGEAPAGCLFLLPLWNPVLVAEQVATLAAFHRGRFIMQCALGGDRRQFAAMGVELRHRPSLFEEGLDLIRRLWAGETVDGAKRYAVRGARIAPLPPEPIDVWIGGSAEAAIDRAARLGDGFLGGPELTPEQAARCAAFYRERCRARGREASTIALRRDVYVGDSAEEAEAVAGAIVRRGYRGFDPSAPVYGTPGAVVEALRAFGEMGYTDIIIRHIPQDQAAVLSSFRRLREVRLALRN